MHGKFLKILYSDSSFSNFPKASNLAKFLTFGAINASITHHSLKYNYAPLRFQLAKEAFAKHFFRSAITNSYSKFNEVFIAFILVSKALFTLSKSSELASSPFTPK